jgi:hypothetical protein
VKTNREESMKYAKPEIETARLATHVVESRYQKGFIAILDNILFFMTLTAYESDE